MKVKSAESGAEAGVGATRARAPFAPAVCALAILASAVVFWLVTRDRGVAPFNSGPSAETHYTRGIKLADSGSFKAAEEELLTAIALNPGYAPAHFALADLYDSAGRPSMAAEKLKSLLSANPATPHVQCRRAELYLKADGFEKVVETARKELELAPNCPLGNSVMGMALKLAGDADGAIAHLTTASRFAPQDERITRTLAQVLGQAGRTSEALSTVKVLVHGETTSGVTEYMLGWLMMRQGASNSGSDREALKHLTKAVSLSPDSGAANGALGLLFAKMQMPSDALKFLERAQKAGSLDLEMARAMAKVYADLKRPDAPKMAAYARDKEAFDSQLKDRRANWLAHPDSVKNTLALAEMEARRGDIPDARDMVIGELKKDPNQPEALRLLVKIVGKK
jgi:tetratricopeptide (TPR) repeat protein